jgi:hypothetical protein
MTHPQLHLGTACTYIDCPWEQVTLTAFMRRVALSTVTRHSYKAHLQGTTTASTRASNIRSTALVTRHQHTAPCGANLAYMARVITPFTPPSRQRVCASPIKLYTVEQAEPSAAEHFASVSHSLHRTPVAQVQISTCKSKHTATGIPKFSRRMAHVQVQWKYLKPTAGAVEVLKAYSRCSTRTCTTVPAIVCGQYVHKLLTAPVSRHVQKHM